MNDFQRNDEQKENPGHNQMTGAQETAKMDQDAPSRRITEKVAQEKPLSCVDELPPVKAYLDRIGAEAHTMHGARVRELDDKYFRTVASIRFKEGAVTVHIPDSAKLKHEAEEYEPTEQEAAAIKEALASAKFLEITPITNPTYPERLETARRLDFDLPWPQNFWAFPDAEGRVGIVQIRVEDNSARGSHYEVWCRFSDNIWRLTEPEMLPLYNADRLKGGTVFIHEGAKAAAKCQWMADRKDNAAKELVRSHPWGEVLAHTVHVGWIGGALSVNRTDWSILQKAGVEKVYIVADNDKPGRSAIRKISRALQLSAEAILFNSESDKDFAEGFDLGDDPEKGPEHWPSFNQVLQPASWIARAVPAAKGKPVAVLTPMARAEWAYLSDLELIVHREHRRKQLTPQQFDNAARPFCDAGVGKPSQLIMASQEDMLDTWCYRPGSKKVVLLPDGSRAFNVFLPALIKPKPGDAAPWIGFLAQLLPDEDERHELMRWCATLIARPDVRMSYGLLLISEAQGTGKSTLSDMVLAPLVGPSNVSWPRNEDLSSQFNSWAARKRLVIAREIYQFKSWKVYHMLKEVITDRTLSINEKNRPMVATENWCHVVASSNTLNALKIDDQDRRWFIPTVTETGWKKHENHKFAEFRKWLAGDGLAIIAHWAAAFEDYVKPEEPAPVTIRKSGIIEDSRAEAARAVLEWAQGIVEVDEKATKACVSFSQVRRWAKRQGHIPDTELRRVLKLAGLIEDVKETTSGRRRRIKLGADQKTNHTIWGTAQFWESAPEESFKPYADDSLHVPVDEM
jgi:hypothetical protein